MEFTPRELKSDEGRYSVREAAVRGKRSDERTFPTRESTLQMKLLCNGSRSGNDVAAASEGV
ncbi:hypothetical protein RB213_004488 [Colletotrichum asianum]